MTWDPELWGLTTSAEEGMGYEYDFAGLSTVFLFAIAQVQYVEAPFDDLEGAADGAVEHYIGGFGMTLDDAEVLDQWASDEAAGGLFYWLGYDDIPYTYIEYAPTEDEDVWSVSYIQVRASAWDAEAMTDVLQAIWIDEAPFVRATDVDEIVDAMVADME